MATIAAARSVHPTLTGTTVDTVTLSAAAGRLVDVLNRTGTANLTITTDGVAPVAAADDTDIVLPGGSTRVQLGGAGAIKVLGNGNAYSVILVA